ncbi:MAG: SGNH/GDSL hydrolase family protein [Geminicoccaceae bacterium]
MRRSARKMVAAAGLVLAGCASNALDEDELVYTAIGASDAFGIGAVPITDGYVFRIEDALERDGSEVALINLGIPAANTDRINGAVHIFTKTGVRANLVTVWVGANDLIDGVDVDDFEDELEELLDRVQKGMEAVVVIANIPDLTELPRFQTEPDPDVTLERVEAYNDVIEEAADDRDIPVVELFAEDIGDELVSDVDGFHPNNAGHQEIADAFLVVIRPTI